MTSPEDLERLLLGGPRRYTRVDVARLAGVPLAEAVDLWRALGFADTADDEVMFTDADVATVRQAHALAGEWSVDERSRVAIARMLGQSMSRLAEWQVRLLVDRLGRGAQVDMATLLPALEEIQGYAWRRHLAAHVGRVFAPETAGETVTAVGFADLVGFTSLSRRLSEDELGTLLDRFEATAAEVVADRGGRVVKMLGDEVMYVAGTARAAADIALELVERITDPALRAGVALGRVLPRYGDVYGPVVNLAARLTGAARPGTVLADRELATALGADGGYEVSPLRTLSVRGYPHLRPYRLRRS